MEYVRRLSSDPLEGTPGRAAQALFEAEHGATGCSVRWIQTPVGGGSPEGLHTHVFDQLFFVLGGVMSIEIDGERHEATADTVVLFPAGVPHRNWNEGSVPTIHVAVNTLVPGPGEPVAQRVDG